MLQRTTTNTKIIVLLNNMHANLFSHALSTNNINMHAYLFKYVQNRYKYAHFSDFTNGTPTFGRPSYVCTIILSFLFRKAIIYSMILADFLNKKNFL